MTLDELARALLPSPRSMQAGDGRVALAGRRLTLSVEGAISMALLAPWQALLARFNVDADPVLPALPLRLRGERPLPATPAAGMDEGYRLDLTQDGVRVQAGDGAAQARARATLVQLLHQAASAGPLPCLRIDDAPAYAWRGLLIDVARHFLPLTALLRTLDGMAQFKLNVLHLHLSDDQAFRFPSARYPALNDGGQAYSREDLATLVSQAAQRGIRVLPELDMPGHTTSWLAAYPEWALYPVQRSERFGPHAACLNPCSETTYAVIGDLFDELVEVFPDPYVHIGGDEVKPRWWLEHPDVQRYMAARQIADVPTLQAHFTSRVVGLLRERGRRALVWDEALHADLPADVTVQSWRGFSARDRVRRAGHPGIVSAPYYLDLMYNADQHTRFAPDMASDAALAAEDALLDDPRLAHVASGLGWTRQWRDVPLPDAAAQPGALLGAEACLWGELVDAATLDLRLWSRLPLLAEVFWRGTVFDAEQPAPADFLRLAPALAAWERFGGPALAAAFDGALTAAQRRPLEAVGLMPALVELLAVLEPVKWYGRLLGETALAARLAGSEMPQARPYQVSTPLRGVADLLSPQSQRAAELAALLERWRAGPLSAADRRWLDTRLADWRKQPALLDGLALSAERVPGFTSPAHLRTLAQHLAAFADGLHQHLLPHADTALRPAALQPLEAALPAWQEPAGELLLALVAPVLMFAAGRAR